MCSHFQIAQGLKEFFEEFGIEPEDVPPPPTEALDAKPTDPVAVVLRNPKTDVVEVRYPRWGLVPSWSNEVKASAKLIHARAETLAEKPSFREAFRKRRCIMPLASFFEFDRTSRYRVCLADGSFMGVAGLWEWKRMGDEPPLVTCAMVTTAPNELIEPVHDRMPAILRREDYEAWLDPEVQEPGDLLPLLAPLDPSEMTMEFDGLKKAAKQKLKDESLF